jgi:type II secretion system protein J
MNRPPSQKGFTLVEILVAVALIATILSMVYGSYFATSRSAQVGQARIVMCRQGQKTLDQIARQIRCAYAGTTADDADLKKNDTQQTKRAQEDSIRYFNGNLNASNGEILHFVTTNGLVEKDEPSKGLFEITYRFDKRRGELSLRQERFIATTKKPETGNWRSIAKNIEHLKLEFYDGEQWQRRWDFMNEKKLPCAVRLEIDCKDEDGRRYNCGTVANISCRKDRAVTNIETFASADK